MRQNAGDSNLLGVDVLSSLVADVFVGFCHFFHQVRYLINHRLLKLVSEFPANALVYFILKMHRHVEQKEEIHKILGTLVSSRRCRDNDKSTDSICVREFVHLLLIARW